MITIETENYNYISQDFYNKTIDSLDLNLIPCTCGHSGCLIRYGSYKRKIQLCDEVITLSIVRVYCTACAHTHALLLSSIIPYSQIPAAVHAETVSAFENGTSLSSVLTGQCYVDESNLRAIIRSYRFHWQERLRAEGLFLFPVCQLVRKCFLHFSRQFMQIKKTRNHLFLVPT